jgi:hypothetical protein
MTVLAPHSRDHAALDELSAHLTDGTTSLARDTRNFAARMERLHVAVERALAAARQPESCTAGAVVVASAGRVSPPG